MSILCIAACGTGDHPGDGADSGSSEGAGSSDDGGPSSQSRSGSGAADAGDSGNPGTGGQDAGSAAPSTLVNRYDGARATTVSFDSGWKFHLGDVTGAQATTFDDSSWTAVDVPHDWSISLPFNQGLSSVT